MNNRNIGKYLLYAIGEILLITIGVLIAINLNKKAISAEHQKLRCQYLNELNYTFQFDIEDVEENIEAFEEWNPKIDVLIRAIQNDKLLELDSVNDKIITVRRFIHFLQRTSTKMEELNQSTIDLVGNRSLKNKLLLYKDEQIERISYFENKYNLVDEDIRRYYNANIYSNWYSVGMNYKSLQEDKYFLALIAQKFYENDRMTRYYKEMREKQIEIKELIKKEIETNCN